MYCYHFLCFLDFESWHYGFSHRVFHNITQYYNLLFTIVNLSLLSQSFFAWPSFKQWNITYSSSKIRSEVEGCFLFYIDCCFRCSIFKRHNVLVFLSIYFWSFKIIFVFCLIWIFITFLRYNFIIKTILYPSFCCLHFCLRRVSTHDELF